MTHPRLAAITPKVDKQCFCKRGDKCWFRHVDPSSDEATQESDTCSICLEKPVIYGLLSGCSHVFCLQCIRQWREQTGKPVDVIDSGNTKKCPMCRERTRFITPSSKFYKTGDPRKELIVQQYKESMARVPCKYFEDSKDSSRDPFCPFGKDCFYQHLNADGSIYTFKDGIDHCMRLYHNRRRQQMLDFPFPFDFGFPQALAEQLELETSTQLAQQLEIASRALLRAQDFGGGEYDLDQINDMEERELHLGGLLDSEALQDLQRALGSIRATVGRLATGLRDEGDDWISDPMDDWDFWWQDISSIHESQTESEGRVNVSIDAVHGSSL
ncbi:hypothetical protein AX16_010409 [Volvariella volvacea WC 439]|nr:hypothetical protein AX16_010409 [Volvariella volvacea WC 439]